MRAWGVQPIFGSPQGARVSLSYAVTELPALHRAREVLFGQQAMLHREQAGAGTVRHVDLGVDVFDVVRHRFG